MNWNDEVTGLLPSNKGAWFYETTRPFEDEGSWLLTNDDRVGDDVG